MKKIIFLFLLIMSFQIYPEGKYTEAAKKANDQHAYNELRSAYEELIY